MQEFTPLFRNRHFMALWISQILSQITVNLLNFLFILTLYERTRSTIATSFLWISFALPAIFVGPIAAATADIVDRKKMIMFTNISQSFAVLLYAFVNRTSSFLIFGIAIIYSFFNQFYVPAEQASLPQIVGEKYFASGNTLFFLTQQAAILIGFAIAGFMRNIVGFEITLILCSIFLFLAFLSSTFLPSFATSFKFTETFEKDFFKFFERIMEGYNFIKSKRTIMAPLALLLIVQVGLAIIVVNIPVIAEQIFKINVEDTGLLIVPPTALGAGLAALLIPRFLHRSTRKTKIIENSVFYLVISTLLMVSVLSFIYPPFKFIVGALLLATMGFCFVGLWIPSQTLLQEKTPQEYRGRVFGNFWFLVTIATVFPVLASGTITDIFGIRLLLFILAMVFLIILLFIKKSSRQFLNREGIFADSNN